MVVQAGDRANLAAMAALETLCQRYWFPLYALVARGTASTMPRISSPSGLGGEGRLKNRRPPTNRFIEPSIRTLTCIDASA